jgi:uncharacterized protein (TIGR00290 family)
MKKTYFNWSTGKDASMALHHLMQSDEYSVNALLTTVNSHHNRVTMHGLRNELLFDQVKSIGIPSELIQLPESPSMEEYGQLMQEKVDELKVAGYTHSAFGDIFLEDLRKYREEQLSDFSCVFPLWKRDTKALIQEFMDLGFKAITVCVNAELLDETFVGREIDQSFIDDLPDSVDPCGENGEFHTFCYDGPIFDYPISFERGEKIYRGYPKPGSPDEETGFWFIDLMSSK